MKFGAIILLHLILLITPNVYGQLSFPNGAEKNIVSSELYLYWETEIIFKTGQYKISDYTYQKMDDSLDSRWFISSCFNGECRDGLPNGDFNADLNPDTSKNFIAFHVQSRGYDGRSYIRYKIINKKDTSDNAIITIDVTYKNIVNINDQSIQMPTVSPNPSANGWLLNGFNAQLFKGYELFNIQGQLIMSGSMENASKLYIDNSSLHEGLYFLNILSDKIEMTLKAIKQ
ncbi:MAG: T9SS type A sorting domain-containing protein [Bacteroidota bacterium]